MYIVIRFVLDTEEQQSNSIQRFDDEIQARKRWHSIIAADIDKETVRFEMVQIIREDGICIASEIIDNRPHEEEVF